MQRRIENRRHLKSTSQARGEVEDAESEERRRRGRSRGFWVLLAEFWRLVRGRRGTVVFGIVTVAIGAGLALVMPASTKIALDYILTDHPGPAGLPDVLGLGDWSRWQLLVLLGACLMLSALLSVSIWLWGRWRMTRLNKVVQAQLRRRVFDHAIRLPLHRVYQLKSGGVTSVLRDDTSGAGDLLFSLIYNPFRAIIQLVGTLIILAVVDWRMLAGAVFIIPAAWFSQKAWIGRIRPVYRDIRNSRTHVDAHVTEAFGGMRIVRGFGRQRGEASRFIVGNNLMSRQEILAWVWSRGIETAWAFLIPAGSVAVLLYGGSQVLAGSLTIGDVMMFSAYLIMLLSPLETLSSTATAIQNQLAAFDRVLDLLAEPLEFVHSPQTVSPSVTVDAADVQGRITIKGLSFTYPGGKEPVLRDVSLDVPAGTTVALVGPSGSGKTTLCNLIARFHDPGQGSIELDGRDLRSIKVDSYRRLLGIVEQDVFLFDGTVEQNIAYGRRHASGEQVRSAAAAANAHDFITHLDQGYRTMLGERGVRLSGGQRQRIAIARAILADPRILILDEATSNLDSESEAFIQASLRELMKGRTCFVIAHRLSTIRHADVIVVLEKGRIVECGTHEELLAHRGSEDNTEPGPGIGRYARFLLAQTDPLLRQTQTMPPRDSATSPA